MRLTNIVATNIQSNLRKWAGAKDGFVLDVVADQGLPRVSILVGKSPTDIMDVGEVILRVTLDISDITEAFDSVLNRAKFEILRETPNPSWSVFDFNG